MKRSLIRPALLAGAVLWTTPAGLAVEEWYEVLESAQGALDGVIREATDGEYGLGYRLVPPEEFQALLAGFHGALRGDDPAALARWLPAGRQALAAMEAVPALEPHADWLRQRLDLAEMALRSEHQRRAAARTRPPASVPPRSGSSPRTVGPPPPTRGKPPPTLGKPPATRGKPAAPPPAVSTPDPAGRAPRLPGDAIVHTEDWRRRLAGRAPPARAETLAPQLKEIFRGHGVPASLIWMAEVESTFNPAARSPVGAVGLFQLMPATARHLGLSTEPVDERLDPRRNAQAAAAYLDYLYQRFDDWPLAIAAYNGGEGRVSRLLARQGTRHFNQIADQLPAETRMYVPKVLATIELREGQALR